jgi:Ribonuclease G/E
MNPVPDKIKKSLQKRQEALEKFTAKRAAFLASKEQIKKEIEEAREIWATTLAQMPNLPFSS